MPGESTKLTRLHRRWCELVNRGMDGTNALRELGYKGKRPNQKAWKIRQLPQVQAYLAHLDANAITEAEVTRTFVLVHLKLVAASLDTDDYASKVGALRELASILGLKKDQLEITGTIVRIIDMTGAKPEKDPDA